MSNNQNITKTETKIIVDYNLLGKVQNPILVIYPDNKETWCKSVDIHDSSTTQYDKNIVYTITQGHVVTHIALEKEEKESLKYTPGMISCAGVEWASEGEEIDFS